MFAEGDKVIINIGKYSGFQAVVAEIIFDELYLREPHYQLSILVDGKYFLYEQLYTKDCLSYFSTGLSDWLNV